MKPQESFLGQPIRDLQTMLRVISREKNAAVPLIPDGIYGTATMQQVSDFQKEHGLPPTGSTDQITWDAILEAYQPARVELRPAQSLSVLLNAGEVIVPGQEDPNVFLVQSILEVLYRTFRSVKSPGFSGILDSQTEASIRSFQLLSGLEVNGKIDKITWKNLVLQYPLAASFQRPLKSEEDQNIK